MPKTKLGEETKNYGIKKTKTALKCHLNSEVTREAGVQFYQDFLAEEDGPDEKEANGLRIFKSPFTCTVIENVVENEQFLEGFQAELEGLDFVEKNNDLYKFRQSGELSSSPLPHISHFRQLLLQQVRPWLQRVTGIALRDTVDMFCGQYRQGDTLLCHDDELEGRRVAFIYYLVPRDWSLADGGSLDLFTTDEGGNPGEVARRLPPAFNSLAFFEVSAVSFHQVSEVLSAAKTRLSVGGWFHGDSLPRPPRTVPAREPCEKCQDIPEEDFYSWINPVYLGPATQAEVQEKFEESSEISLPDFLQQDKFQQVAEALKALKDWKLRGLPDRRRCQEHDGRHSEVLTACRRLFQSEPFFLLLSNLTGLKLHELAPEDSEEEEESSEEKVYNPRCRASFMAWLPGNYTLVRDDDLEQEEFALDLRIFFNSSGWLGGMGGQSSYIARGEDEELITVEPEDNSLSLVYRDKESLRWAKPPSCPPSLPPIMSLIIYCPPSCPLGKG